MKKMYKFNGAVTIISKVWAFYNLVNGRMMIVNRGRGMPMRSINLADSRYN